jgi:hypothetical protein
MVKTMLPASAGFSASCASRSDSHPLPCLRLRSSTFLQVFAGAGLGLLIALAIGAAFVAIWFTQASNLWAKSEALWEGRLRTTQTMVTKNRTLYRYLLSASFRDHHDYGHHHAQDGSCKGKVAIEAPEGVRRQE